MVAIYPIASLFVVFALALLVVRTGAIALRMTGLTPDIASFQAASAFSGAGFTTAEAERVVSTPERRRIVKALILLGNLGLVSAITSLVLSFTRANGGGLRNLVLIVVGITSLVHVARSDWLNRLVTPLIERFLRRTTDLELTDYTQVLGLQRDYRVAEIDVRVDEWLANETPREIGLGEEGVLLLGIRRDDTYIGAPDADTEIEPGDTVVLYGKEERLRELSTRNETDYRTHIEAIREHEREQTASESTAG